MALLQFKPAPMYILDEVDAALDLYHTQNIGRLIKTRFKGSQFIVVSLKDGMFQNANRIFRTRFQDGTSVVQSLTAADFKWLWELPFSSVGLVGFVFGFTASYGDYLWWCSGWSQSRFWVVCMVDGWTHHEESMIKRIPVYLIQLNEYMLVEAGARWWYGLHSFPDVYFLSYFMSHRLTSSSNWHIQSYGQVNATISIFYLIGNISHDADRLFSAFTFLIDESNALRTLHSLKFLQETLLPNLDGMNNNDNQPRIARFFASSESTFND